jgi:hypothetical protein
MQYQQSERRKSLLQAGEGDGSSSRRCVARRFFPFTLHLAVTFSSPAHPADDTPPKTGCNFRKATTPSQAFPAALQDALATYAHLVLTLGYRDVALAGDSAGGGLAINLLQYLALTVPKAGGLVLPSGLLLFSPWSDLTASTYGESMKREYEDDIICASMATNSIRCEPFLPRFPVSFPSS